MLTVKRDSVISTLMIFNDGTLIGLIGVIDYDNTPVYEALDTEGHRIGMSPVYGEALNLITQTEIQNDEW